MKVIIRVLICAILILIVYNIFLSKREYKFGYLLDIHSTELERYGSDWLVDPICEMYHNREVSLIVIRDTDWVDVNLNKDILMSVYHSLITKEVPDSMIILDFNRLDLDSVKTRYNIDGFMWIPHQGISDIPKNSHRRRLKQYWQSMIDKITEKEI